MNQRMFFVAALALAMSLPISERASAQQQPPAFTFTEASPANYPGEIKLGTGPGQPREEWFRLNGTLQVRNVSDATLTPFLPPEAAATGAAVLVAPGGGFLGLSIEEEGYRVAKWLADHGIAAFVLKYRLLPTPTDPATFRREMVALRTGRGPVSFRLPDGTPPEALADGQAAIRHIRANAAKYGVDPKRVGMMGFSAGAFTTMSVALAKSPDAAPAFIAPIYGGQEAVEVPAKAPPMYVVLASDDALFGKGGFGLVDSWHKAGAPVEMHFYQNGGHGFGLGRGGTTTTDWIEGFRRWLEVNGMLHP